MRFFLWLSFIGTLWTAILYSSAGWAAVAGLFLAIAVIHGIVKSKFIRKVRPGRWGEYHANTRIDPW